jgi:hypothetical protein
MVIEVSGEILRLLGILSVRAHGATQHELTVLEGVSANLIYKAVTSDLVQARPERRDVATSYRFYLLDARSCAFCRPMMARFAEIKPAIFRTTSRSTRQIKRAQLSLRPKSVRPQARGAWGRWGLAGLRDVV